MGIKIGFRDRVETNENAPLSWRWRRGKVVQNMMEKVIGRAVVIAADDTTEAGVRDAIRDAIGSWALS